MSTRDLLAKLIYPTPTEPPKLAQPGLYHYMRSAGQDTYEAGSYTRFHLRVDPDGSGLLLANASAALHLSPSGVIIAKGLLDDENEDEIIDRLKRIFRGADTQMMLADLEQVAALINSLVSPGDRYPIMNLEDAALSPYDAQLMAPFQADVMLMPPDQMAPVLDRLWRAGIPHVTFMTSPEGNQEFLVRAVERAEDLGMIAGVRARATDLAAPAILDDLAMAGLDHGNILLASADPARHDLLCGPGDHARALAIFKDLHRLEVAPVAEIPLLEDSATTLRLTLGTLLQHDVSNVNFLVVVAPNEMSSADRAGAPVATALPQLANLVEEMAAEMDVRFVWQPPVERDPSMTLTQQVHLGPRCTSDLSIRVLPGGDVLPPRGPAVVAGNLLSDDWRHIWANAAFRNYRERVERPTHCEECPGLVICAADCPREAAGRSQGLGGNFQ